MPVPARDTADVPVRTEDQWNLVAVAGTLAFVAMLDMNIVNVALADLGADLGVSAETAQWAVLGYQLPVVALLFPAGRWLDTAGVRAALLLSICGFAAASAAAALTPWVEWLIAVRVMQGCFGAVLFVLMPVLAARAVRPERRGRAMSVPATLGPLGAVVGPAVGGVLLDHAGWRAIFLVKIPFCVAALVVAWRAVPRDGRLPVPGRREAGDALLIGGAMTAILLALTFAPESPGSLALAAVGLVPLAAWARGSGGREVLSVVRSSRTLSVDAAVLALGAAFAAMHYLVAIHLQRDVGTSGTATGLTVLAFPLAMGLAGPVGGRLADRWGARPVAVAGATVTTTGLVSLVLLGGDWSPPEVAWRLALAGLGMGLYGGPSQALVMTSVPPGRMPTAGAAVQFARSVGFALGPALAVAAWGVAGSGADGVRAGLALAAALGCLAVVLLATGRAAPAVRA